VKIRFSLAVGLGVTEVPGCGPVLAGMIFLRNSLLRLIFWTGAAFLNTDGFAGVERGVGGVEVPSYPGVLAPVLVPSFGRTVSDVASAEGISVSPECSLASISYSISLENIAKAHWCIGCVILRVCRVSCFRLGRFKMMIQRFRGSRDIRSTGNFLRYTIPSLSSPNFIRYLRNLLPRFSRSGSIFLIFGWFQRFGLDIKSFFILYV
jgi:hypothetical protein